VNVSRLFLFFYVTYITVFKKRKYSSLSGVRLCIWTKGVEVIREERKALKSMQVLRELK
jgi:hypothetical protein